MVNLGIFVWSKLNFKFFISLGDILFFVKVLNFQSSPEIYYEKQLSLKFF